MPRPAKDRAARASNIQRQFSNNTFYAINKCLRLDLAQDNILRYTLFHGCHFGAQTDCGRVQFRLLDFARIGNR
jgi:hypothetical protein